jgi:hypothetical protein
MSLPVVPVVFADANVLYNSALRDILIELALADIIRLHWSPLVLDELSRPLFAPVPITMTPRRFAWWPP